MLGWWERKNTEEPGFFWGLHLSHEAAQQTLGGDGLIKSCLISYANDEGAD